MPGWNFENTVQDIDPFIWLSTALDAKGNEQYKLVGLWQISEDTFYNLYNLIG
jgi:hypothetical protein